MESLGVIGLGNMGGGAARTLLERGWRLLVHDAMPDRLEACVRLGAEGVPGYRQMAAECGAILLFLPMAPSQPVLESVVLGEDGLHPHLRPGTFVIDCGNTSPTLTRRLAEALDARGVPFLDAAISGGPQGAQAGTATLMVGGDEASVTACRPLLEAMGGRFAHFGAVGAGQTAKLCNNILVAANLAALSEVLVLAERNGIDLEKWLELVSSWAGGSWVLDNYGREIVARAGREEEVGPRLEYSRHIQLFWAMQMADAADIPLPMTALTHQQFTKARGLGKRGACEPIVEMLEDMTGADVQRKT